MTDVAAVVRELIVLLLIALAVILLTRRLTIPYTLGLVVVGFLISLFGLLPEIRLTPDLVLFVFLPALLFEGSWSISGKHLRENWLPIFLLAVPGLLLSLLLIALPLHFLTELDWGTAFLLSAILSPTDPVAVLGLFRQLRVDIGLATVIEGESLFNDGVAGSLYQVLLSAMLVSAHGHALPIGQGWMNGIAQFVLESGGGVLIGALAGFLVSRLVKLIDEPLIETTITIVTAYGVYLLADALHASGILAVIAATLLLSGYGRQMGMSEQTSEAVDSFWTMIAFLANALLFLLVGAQLNPLQFITSPQSSRLLLMAGLSIMTVLLARFVMVQMLRLLKQPLGTRFINSGRFVIFWSGLRGALSLALVLALPTEVPSRQALVFSTYAVVLFTLLVQGFSLRFILQHLPGVQRLPPA